MSAGEAEYLLREWINSTAGNWEKMTLSDRFKVVRCFLLGYTLVNSAIDGYIWFVKKP